MIAMDLEAHRPTLFALAYRMLGSASDAEDVVQEAFLRVSATGEEARAPRAYLRTVTTRICLDRLKSARHRRERVGASLPEPIVEDDAERTALLAESLSFAFLRMLESLSPLERAVFLLREVFELDHREIAAAVDRSEAACRQTYRRAKQHLAAGRPRFEAAEDQHRELTARFAAASERADYAALLELLSPGVVLHVDGADVTYGRAKAIGKPLGGRERVARFVTAVQAQAPADAAFRIERVNGAPSLLSYVGGALVAVLSLRIEDGRVAEIFLVADPAKLDRVRDRFPRPR